MKIAIISDIHENYHNLVLFIREIEKSKDIEQIICLGDFVNGGIVKILANLSIPTFAIWGNNTGSKVEIMKTVLDKKNNLTITSDENFDFLTLAGRNFFLTHYPSLAEPMAKSGDFDAVFYGHDHVCNIEKIKNCLIVNPGEISSHKTGRATFALYDTKTNSAEIITLKGNINMKTQLAKDYLKEIGFKF
jgi:putative phosphoesterase